MPVSQVIPYACHTPPEGELDERGQRRYRWTYAIITDDANDGIQVVGDAPGTPLLYSPYIQGNDIDTEATLKSKKVRRDPGSLTLWWMDLEWDSSLESFDQGFRDPLARRRKKRWTSVTYEVPIGMDRFGNPIQNAAQDDFDPPVMRHRNDARRLIYQTNVATENQVATAFSYLDTVNSDGFQGAQPKMCSCIEVEADEEFDNHKFYWSLTMTFEFRKIITNPNCKIHEVSSQGVISNIPTNIVYPWNVTVCNRGFNQIDAAGKKKRILGDDGKPSPQPERLFPDGGKQFPNNPASETVFLTWEICEPKPYIPLGIT